jgi:H+-translocating NAD(P) transhydrogenase subunit beta
MSMTTQTFINCAYILSTLLFIFGIKKLTSPQTARLGNFYSALAMLFAIVVTLLDQSILSYQWIGVGLVIGTILGLLAARLVAMTAMPELVALLNGFGGIASLLVAWAVYFHSNQLDPLQATTIVFTVIIGSITFFGSMVAWGKLSQIISGNPLILPGSQIINGVFILGLGAVSVMFWLNPESGQNYFYFLLGLSSLFGILSVLRIGGADMPVVISLLNSCSGIAASAAGFVVNNILLVVAGALVGASGIILTILMCKAMNRSLLHVIVGGFGGSASKHTTITGKTNPITAKDVFYILEAAQKICVVPGYGLAVAQAQHAIQELAEILQSGDREVIYGIHPVAGRMPGHMNVLLAEANVPYENLYEMSQVNPLMPTQDVTIVVGANDVVNLSARDIPGSPIAGMPIINVDQSKVVVVIKRSMKPGFSGVDNPLFYKNNTRMLFGDAKSALQELISEFKT